MEKNIPYHMEIIELCSVIEALFDEENGCPFDKEQSIRSMCKYIIDEVYELVDAVYARVDANVAEELGDVLFLLVMLLKVYSKEKKVVFVEALNSVIAKMKRRHPYVFANATMPKTMEEYICMWEKIKREEKENNLVPQAISLVPQSAHSFSKAIQIQKKFEVIEDSTNTFYAQQLYAIIAEANNNGIDILDELEEYNQRILSKNKRR